MRTETGVMAVVWKQSGSRRRYAVLHRDKNWEGWELPKGHMEGSPEETLKMELREEAGIKPKDIERSEELDQNLSWTFEDNGETVKKEYQCFCVQVSKDVIIDVQNNPCNEHAQGLFLRFGDVHGLLEYKDQRDLLKEVHKNR